MWSHQGYHDYDITLRVFSQGLTCDMALDQPVFSAVLYASINFSTNPACVLIRVKVGCCQRSNVLNNNPLLLYKVQTNILNWQISSAQMQILFPIDWTTGTYIIIQFELSTENIK